ncbi:MAG TPA: lipoxygenase family protein [Saprospiraceae bacterium]|nr:lipoxygenase family protein [Saprospiraceae bacterium]
MNNTTICLPQQEPHYESRLTKLERTRTQYLYDHQYIAPIPLHAVLPEADTFSGKYKQKKNRARATVLANILINKARAVFDPFNALRHFDRVFALLPRPATLSTWDTDAFFAEQRLSGANPMKIARVRHRDELPFDLNSLGASHATTLDRLLAAGQLYVADYRDMNFVRGGLTPSGKQKYLPTPVALFYWQASENGKGSLLPLAIQPVAGGPVYTPGTVSATDWFIAKLAVQIADANHHELCSHLCHTHFVMEAFALATFRQMADNHPLHVLLSPHFRFHLATTNLAKEKLVGPSGIVNMILAGTLEDSQELLSASFKSWSLKSSHPVTHTSARGLSADELPLFPYRDDAQLLWDAILGFVNDYVCIYYQTNADVQNDRELQAWIAELSSSEYGNARDLPARLQTREEVAELLALIIFNCGPQHSAVNFSQYDYMANIPNMPMAAYCPVPAPGVLLTREAVAQEMLPDLKQTNIQVGFAHILTAFHQDRLGRYADGTFSDVQALKAVERFQQRLKEIETQIDERNQDRLVPYKFLKPSEILNSISI